MTGTGSPGPIRVVVVEDSHLQRVHLVSVLEVDGDISVVAQATTALEAIRLVAENRPNVVTLDLHLPDRSGNYVIEQVMANSPCAILVLSSIVEGPQSSTAIEALVRGALEALPKPVRWTPDREVELRQSIRALARVPVIRHIRGRATTADPTPRPGPVSGPVVAIGASTGGPAALAEVVGGLSDVPAPVLIVQHIHPDFVIGLVNWMSRASALPVHIARHGEPLVPGHVYIGPGNLHLRVDAHHRIALTSAPAAIHRPSADELFDSVAEHYGPAGIGVVMTGMGSDGARGLLALRSRGGRTIGQDETSSAVYGMPQAAYRLGAVSDMVALADIAATVLRAVRDVRS